MLFQLLAACLAGLLTTSCFAAERTVWLDELQVDKATSGWGSVRRNQSVGGGPLRLAGAEYERGVGTHAPSTLHLALDGRTTRFEALIGVDDEAAPPASVRFRVVADGQTLFDSGTMRPIERQKLALDVCGVRHLTLHVDDAGDGRNWDHADWANARFHCEGDAPRVTEPGPRWKRADGDVIEWNVAADRFRPHTDHLEMAGLRAAAIITYGVDVDGSLILSRRVIWPGLRMIPNDTHASLEHTFSREAQPAIRVDGEPIVREVLQQVTIGAGLLSLTASTDRGVTIWRTLLPSRENPHLIERVEVRNDGEEPVHLQVLPPRYEVRTPAERGVAGEYLLAVQVDEPIDRQLAPGEMAIFHAAYAGRQASEEPITLDGEAELANRVALYRALRTNLVLETPDPLLDQMFAFAKLRGAESIFATRGGLMHGPGGGRYYAALWTNDQCEYINPFFPFLGYDIGNKSALNSYRQFARFMDPAFERDLASSVIAEGEGTWNGAGDRGDAAMYAYGAARFALACGDRATAEELWPRIQWCLEYCHRKLNDDGVIASDSDELEGRFPAGNANLCTSSLAYDAYLSAAMLGEDLGKDAEVLCEYRNRAAALRKAIEEHFGASVEGFETYRYFEGNDTLRSWICIPLTVGIDDRAAGTIDALFSPRLWGPDGLATEAGRADFWDRSTLYALRGVFAAGATDRALKRLQAYTQRRLLGQHVPYPVEAYPEGNQRHLSAESGLYCRIITEGLFGIRPTGLRSFEMNPRLPSGWDRMALRRIHAFGTTLDIEVKRTDDGNRRVRVIENGRTLLERETANNAVLRVALPRVDG